MEINFEKIIDYLVELATSMGLKLLAAIVLLIIGCKAIKWLRKWIRTSERLNKIDDSLRSFMISFSFIFYRVMSPYHVTPNTMTLFFLLQELYMELLHMSTSMYGFFCSKLRFEI